MRPIRDHQLRRPLRASAWPLLAACALIFAGCNRPADEGPAGVDRDSGNDTVVSQAERRADQIGQDAREAGRDARVAAGEAADAVANKSRDVAITTEVNMRLARDDQLSALGINVDTNNGHVVMRGSAPDSASRTRATQLARGVDGVVDVSNELTVQPKGK